MFGIDATQTLSTSESTSIMPRLGGRLSVKGALMKLGTERTAKSQAFTLRAGFRYF